MNKAFLMSRKKRVAIFTVVFLIGFIGYLIIMASRPSTNNFGDLSTGVTTETKTNPNLNICGWIPNWASSDGLKSMQENKTLLNCISPVMYEVNNDGSLKSIIPGNIKEMIKFAKDNNIKVIPTIAMFDHEIFSPVLQNEENFKRHISQIMAIFDKYDVDGIDLDYESTKLVDKEKYQQFIVELADKLHAKNKSLVVTVLAKWGDDVEYPSLKETRKVQDWRFLAGYADQIRIMSYDFTYSRSKNPGPIAPLTWMNQIMTYAKTMIPDQKIVLGIHLYSYQWAYESASKSDLDAMPFTFTVDYMQNPSDDKVNIASYDYNVVNKIIQTNTGKSLEVEGEKVFIYQKFIAEKNKYENRVLVYLDQAGVVARKKLASQNNAYGVCYWRLGNEGNLLRDI
jgi:spore germination protein YaaH